MQLTGQITNVNPSGGYQHTTAGYIYTFQMTIQCADGPHTGEIGSKTEIYPIAVGQEISVEMTNSPHGPKFKKFNPQYPQNTQQAPPQAAQPPKADSRDYDRENHGKCFYGFCEARVRSGVDPQALLSNRMELEAMANLATACINSYDYRTSNPLANNQSTMPDDIPI